MYIVLLTSVQLIIFTDSYCVHDAGGFTVFKFMYTVVTIKKSRTPIYMRLR